MAIVNYCWHCFAAQPGDVTTDTACPKCGRSPAAPDGATYADKLLWSLGHPLVERRIIAAAALAERREPRAVAPLRNMAYDDDPYLAAAAIQALARYPREKTADILEAVAARGPAPARHAARSVLGGHPAGGHSKGCTYTGSAEAEGPA